MIDGILYEKAYCQVEFVNTSRFFYWVAHNVSHLSQNNFDFFVFWINFPELQDVMLTILLLFCLIPRYRNVL